MDVILGLAKMLYETSDKSNRIGVVSLNFDSLSQSEKEVYIKQAEQVIQFIVLVKVHVSGQQIALEISQLQYQILESGHVLREYTGMRRLGFSEEYIKELWNL